MEDPGEKLELKENENDLDSTVVGAIQQENQADLLASEKDGYKNTDDVCESSNDPTKEDFSIKTNDSIRSVVKTTKKLKYRLIKNF